MDTIAWTEGEKESMLGGKGKPNSAVLVNPLMVKTGIAGGMRQRRGGEKGEPFLRKKKKRSIGKKATERIQGGNNKNSQIV